MSAMFVLFDFIVFNPLHPETEFNLALMDVAATYFVRLELTTESSFCSSKLTGFAHLSNDFIQNVLYGHDSSRLRPEAYDISIPGNHLPLTPQQIDTDQRQQDEMTQCNYNQTILCAPRLTNRSNELQCSKFYRRDKYGRHRIINDLFAISRGIIPAVS